MFGYAVLAPRSSENQPMPRRLPLARPPTLSGRFTRPDIDTGDDAMTQVKTTAFELPDHLAAKADPALIADDERHFGRWSGGSRS